MAARGSREPERTCIGCRRTRPRAELIRLVRGADGRGAVDPSASAPGRGAYVCRDAACVEQAVRRLARALRARDVDVERIRKDLATVGER